MSSFEEKMAKVKVDRQTFYDNLLVKVLSLPAVKEDIETMKEETDSKTGKPFYEGWTEYDYEQSALDTFLDEPRDALQVEEIWSMVQEAVIEEAEWVTSDAKTFLKDGLDFVAEETMGEKLEEIREGLEDALKRKHGKTA